MRASVLAVLAVALCVHASAQGAGAALAAGSGSSGVLTSTVLYAAHIHSGADGVAMLDLVVLLRGAPGWYAREPRGASVLTGATSNATDGHATASYWMNGGGITVTFATDSNAPTVHLTIASGNAKLVDQAVSPDRDNVVIVDGVGDADQPPKIRTMLIDPRLDGTGAPVTRALRKSRPLTEFAQCGLPLPDWVPDEQGPLGRSLRNAITQSCAELAGVRR